MSDDLLAKIALIGMIPVLNIDKASRAVPLAKALAKGGLPLMEVMFRTDAAAQSIKAIDEQCPDFIIGAGTVLTVEQAQTAVANGAKFLVAPGFNPQVCKWAVDHDIPMVPGTITPTEVEAARVLGLKVLKFFPAVQQGGVAAMRLLSGPYSDVSWVPTGDLTRGLCYEYLSFNKVAAAGGDFMLSYEDIYADNYAKIEQDVEQTILGYLKLHLVSMRADHYPQALPKALIEQCFSQNYTALGTRDVQRAYAYLQRCGVVFDESTKSFDELGRLSTICFSEQLNGNKFILIKD